MPTRRQVVSTYLQHVLIAVGVVFLMAPLLPATEEGEKPPTVTQTMPSVAAGLGPLLSSSGEQESGKGVGN